jgi:hypothetical protein
MKASNESMSSRHAGSRPARSRAGVVLAGLATACGLWFGITAPEVSPVAPGVVPTITAVAPVPGPGVGP